MHTHFRSNYRLTCCCGIPVFPITLRKMARTLGFGTSFLLTRTEQVPTEAESASPFKRLASQDSL